MTYQTRSQEDTRSAGVDPAAEAGTSAAQLSASEDRRSPSDEQLYAAEGHRSAAGDRPYVDGEGDRPYVDGDERSAGGERPYVDGDAGERSASVEYAPDRPDDRSQADASAADPQRAPDDGGLAPGQAADDPVAALWGTDMVQGYRDQWRQLQLRFVDDPHGATVDAAGLLDDAVQSLTTTLAEQKQSLDEWRTSQGEDTERLRAALTRYRDFLDRLLGL